MTKQDELRKKVTAHKAALDAYNAEHGAEIERLHREELVAQEVLDAALEARNVAASNALFRVGYSEEEATRQLGAWAGFTEADMAMKAYLDPRTGRGRYTRPESLLKPLLFVVRQGICAADEECQRTKAAATAAGEVYDLANATHYKLRVTQQRLERTLRGAERQLKIAEEAVRDRAKAKARREAKAAQVSTADLQSEQQAKSALRRQRAARKRLRDAQGLCGNRAVAIPGFTYKPKAD